MPTEGALPMTPVHPPARGQTALAPTLALALALMVALAPGSGRTQTQTVPGSDQTTADAGLSDGEKQGVGCLVGGATLGGASAVAGPSEAILLYGGGLLVPSGSFILWYALLGTMASAGCGIGAVLTPTVLWTADQWDNLTGRAAQELARLSRHLSAAASERPTTVAAR